MRKLLLMAAIGLFSLAAAPAKAQVSVSVNIGSQPQWGPRGYDHVDYYYLPEVQSYYYVPTRQFVYLDGNRWIHARRLPSRYRNYDLYGARKIVINNTRDPWMRHGVYHRQYGGGYGRPGRMIARENYRRETDRRVRMVERNDRGGRGDWGRNDLRARGGDNRGRDNGNRHDRGGDRFGRGHR